MAHPLAAMASLVVVLTAGTATLQDAPKTAPAVKEVMTTMTAPASDAIFLAAYEPPTQAAQWVALRASARALADSGRLLATSARAKNDTQWAEMARGLVTQAEATFKAIAAKDTEALAAAGDRVYATCATCHARYLGR